MQKNQDTKRKKVLIAEDEKFLGEILLTKFSSVGYATTLARDGVDRGDDVPIAGFVHLWPLLLRICDYAKLTLVMLS